MREWYERGRDFYFLRLGQFDFACTHCHDENAGKKLRGDVLSEGHGNGFPVYRLGWQKPGSLPRCLADCKRDLRAESYPLGSDEYLALEVFLAARARGLPPGGSQRCAGSQLGISNTSEVLIVSSLVVAPIV
ncbi:MAG: putative sulfur oxidation diheme cytochrome SoxA [Rhodospirillaceae bacterium]|nr:MAG: putative sulfur oxidation diheme cytochrome SoxA [Rhodospirillaceae bacterium]